MYRCVFDDDQRKYNHGARECVRVNAVSCHRINLVLFCIRWVCLCTWTFLLLLLLSFVDNSFALAPVPVSFNHGFIHFVHSLIFLFVILIRIFHQWEMCTTFLIIKPWMDANERLSINFVECECEGKKSEINLYICFWVFGVIGFFCDEMRMCVRLNK